jgi:hypothetical protein
MIAPIHPLRITLQGGCELILRPCRRSPDTLVASLHRLQPTELRLDLVVSHADAVAKCNPVLPLLLLGGNRVELESLDQARAVAGWLAQHRHQLERIQHIAIETHQEAAA